MTIDPAGANLWLFDGAAVLRRVEISTRRVSTLTGTYSDPSSFPYADGGAAVARFGSGGLAYADNFGNLIIPDAPNCRIRKVVIATAFTSTIAGQRCGNDAMVRFHPPRLRV